jgi:leader peptidase (prepilin peptidase)/N-methyltransferase
LIEALLVLAGLVCGHILNRLIDREAPPQRRLLPPWLARLAGGRGQLALLVLALAAGMAVLLYRTYGQTPRAGLIFAAALVLIHTGAIDWRVRLIDTLVMVVGAVVLLAASRYGVGWAEAFKGALGGGIAFLVIFIIARALFPAHAAPFGLGDVYLAIFIGALVGISRLPAALFYGMLMAGLVSLGIILARYAGREMPTYISYGTYLCLGALIYLVAIPIRA